MTTIIFNAETQRTRRGAEWHDCNQNFLDCGGKRSATPLSNGRKSPASSKTSLPPEIGVAASLCHRSPKSSALLCVLRVSAFNRFPAWQP